MLELAIASGALAGGMNVESCGVLTTPLHLHTLHIKKEL